MNFRSFDEIGAASIFFIIAVGTLVLMPLSLSRGRSNSILAFSASYCDSSYSFIFNYFVFFEGAFITTPFAFFST